MKRLISFKFGFNFFTSNKIKFKFINKDKSITEVESEIGKTLLQVAHENDIDLEGACESSLACSTCHVILEKSLYTKLKQPVPEEEDLLDLAFGLTETSRLGCQVIVDKYFENSVIKLPKATRNFYVDGHKPKPH